jgi:tripartite-type tricarboxylate transporter receptor subunit TctC
MCHEPGAPAGFWRKRSCPTLPCPTWAAELDTPLVQKRPWQGFVLPAKTPDAIIVKLRDTYVAAVADPIVRQKVIDAGAELLQSSPQEMADHMRKEAAKWAEVIRTADIQLD